MSGKSIALLTAGAGTVTVSFGGVYLFGENGTGAEGNGQGDSQLDIETGGGNDTQANSQPETGVRGGANVTSQSQADTGAGSQPVNSTGAEKAGTTQTTIPAPKELKFSSLTEFKEKKRYQCSSSTGVFPDSLDWSNLSTITELSKDDPTASDYFGNPASDESKIKSCLIINWEKKTYIEQGNKWSGTFTWTWSFINDNKGFISVGIATTSAGQLDLTGGAYLLENQNDSNWKIKYKKEIESTDKKAITKSNFDEYFPKVKEGSGVSDGNGDFWGFTSGSSDLDKACGGSEACPKDAQKIKTEAEEFEWTFNKGGNSKKISEWTANWKWWEEMYGSNYFDLKKSLKKFKGTWSKV